jgi:hypothetical protein
MGEYWTDGTRFYVETAYLRAPKYGKDHPAGLVHLMQGEYSACGKPIHSPFDPRLDGSQLCWDCAGYLGLR